MSFPRFNKMAGAFALALLLQHPGPASAQTLVKQTDAKLAVQVQVPAGQITMQALTVLLSQKTGLQIRVDPSLTSRNIFLSMPSAQVRDVLNALAQLNDWKWEETEIGKIVIRRQILSVPQKMEELPKALQSTMPKDIRTFLGIGVPDANTSDTFAPDSSHPIRPRPIKPYEAANWSYRRSLNALNMFVPLWLDTMETRFWDTPPTVASDLNAAQREGLLRLLLFSFLKDPFSWGINAFHGSFKAFELDFNAVKVSLSGESVKISATTTVGDTTSHDEWVSMEEKLTPSHPVGSDLLRSRLLKQKEAN